MSKAKSPKRGEVWERELRTPPRRLEIAKRLLVVVISEDAVGRLPLRIVPITELEARLR